MITVAKPSLPNAPVQPARNNLLLYFAVAYIGQGLATQWGLIAQPLQFFMMKGLNMNAAQISQCLAIMMLPWVAKPIYGFVCDFIPLFGYRRKSYLIVASLLSAAAFGVMAFSNSLPVILVALLFSAFGMSMGTAVMMGLAVEEGRKTGKAKEYFSSQSFWYYTSNIVAAIVGGLLCQNMIPQSSLNSAALLAIIPLLLTAMLTPFMLDDEKTRFDPSSLKETWQLLKHSFSNRLLWLAALMYFCFNFFPAFGVPLYVFESKTLQFSQNSIGQLSAWYAGGMILGATIFGRLLKDKQLTTQLIISVVMLTISTLSYLALNNFTTAIVLEIFRGTSTTIMLLSIYALASEVCPKRAEVSVMALLVAVRNLATESCTFTGGTLMTHVFNNQYYPLVILAAVCSSLCGVLVFIWHKSRDYRFIPNQQTVLSESIRSVTTVE